MIGFKQIEFFDHTGWTQIPFRLPSAPALDIGRASGRGDLSARNGEFLDFQTRYDAPGSIVGQRRWVRCGRFSMSLPQLIQTAIVRNTLVKRRSKPTQACASIHMAIRPPPTRRSARSAEPAFHRSPIAVGGWKGHSPAPGAIGVADQSLPGFGRRPSVACRPATESTVSVTAVYLRPGRLLDAMA